MKLYSLQTNPAYRKFLAVGGILLFLTSCSAGVRFTSAGSSSSPKIASASGSSSVSSPTSGSQGIVFEGLASFYADKFVGRPTATGEIYSHNHFTAAHRELPFGTILLVTNKNNNRSIKVRVNDRGPFVGNRVLDLSKGAAEALGMIQDGVVPVRAEIADK